MLRNLNTDDLPCLIQTDLHGECLESGYIHRGNVVSLFENSRRSLWFFSLGFFGLFGFNGFSLWFLSLFSNETILCCSFGQCFVNGVAGEGCTAANINLSRGDVLPDQFLKDSLVSDQIGTKSECFIMLRNLNTDNLPCLIKIDFNLKLIEADDIYRIICYFFLNSVFIFSCIRVIILGSRRRFKHGSCNSFCYAFRKTLSV